MVLSNLSVSDVSIYFVWLTALLVMRDELEHLTDRQTGRQAGRQAGRQTDRLTDRQTDTQTDFL